MTYNFSSGLQTDRSRKLFLIAAAASAGILISLTAIINSASAVTISTVRPSDTQGWSTASTGGGGSTTFVAASDSPLPGGALQLTTDATTSAKAQYMHASNVALSDLSDISYWTKQVAYSDLAGTASFQLVVDLDNNGSPDTTLVYEPYWQNGGLGDPAPVAPNVWQEWVNVEDGLFWSSQTTGGLVKAPGGPATYTLADVLALPGNENAVVVGFGVNMGTYNPSYTILVDGVSFDGVDYDFEQNLPIASAKSDCKESGWMSVARPDGTAFSNQGQCVAYVSSNSNSALRR